MLEIPIQLIMTKSGNDLGYKFKNKIYNRRDFIFLQVRSAKAKKAQLNQPVRTKSLLNAAQCTRLCL